MVDFRIDYPEGRNFFFDCGAEDMIQGQSIRETIDQLKAKRAAHVAWTEELDGTIKTLERVLAGSDPTEANPTVVIHNREFAGFGIAEASVIMIKRAHRPLHVREIEEGLRAGGYEFRTQNPKASIAPVLYEAAKAKRHGLVNLGKNTYSLTEFSKQK